MASIVVAMLLMSALPMSFQEIKPDEPIWERGVWVFIFRIGKVYAFEHILGILFALGIIGFGGAVILELYGR